MRVHQILLAGGLMVAAWHLAAQEHEAATAPAAPVAQGAGVFPTRAPGDPVSIGRGKVIYSTNCAYCHGEDARGGENGGTNLLRSEYTMKDRTGEVLGPFLQSSTSNEHKFRFTTEEGADLAAFIHSFRVSSRDPGRMRPPTVVVGDANAGQAYFRTKCAACHSVAGDLKGIASKLDDPRSLQQTWLMPQVAGARAGIVVASAGSNVPPLTVTVTLANGQKVEGNLGRIDDFIVTLTGADGTSRSIRRDGDIPKVEVHDPLKPHKDLLSVYSDKDIHDVTAYLVTIK